MKNFLLRILPKPVALALSLLTALGVCFFASCARKTDYFDYVSENRNNVFLAQNGEYSLKIYAVDRESPYDLDGIKREVLPRTEIRFSAPSGDKQAKISFSANGKEQGGEFSFDSVKAEYFFSCTLDLSDLTEIDAVVTYGELPIEFCAKSVKTDTLLSPRKILDIVVENERERFDSMTTKNGFTGEIYIRLISEGGLYYYVGIADGTGKIYALLLNGETGKILAKRG